MAITAGSGYERDPNTTNFSNAYADQTYRISAWENLFRKIGFRTGYDTWRERMRLDAAERDQQIRDQLYAEQYNDPSSQVARERAAGLNPDLNGGSAISPGEAQTPGQDPSIPAEFTQTDFESFNSATKVFQHGLELSMSVVGALQGVVGKAIQNRALRIAGDNDAIETAKRLLGGLISPTADNSFGVEAVDDGSELGGSLVHAVDYGKKVAEDFRGLKLNVSKRHRRLMNDFVDKFVNSADFKEMVNSKRGAASSAHTDFLGAENEEKAASVVYTTYSDVMQHYNEEYIKAALLLRHLDISKNYSQTMADISSAQNQLQYNRGFSPSSKAAADNAENVARVDESAARSSKSKYDKRLYDGLSPELEIAFRHARFKMDSADFLNKLAMAKALGYVYGPLLKDAENGSLGAKAGLFGLNFIQSDLIQGITSSWLSRPASFNFFGGNGKDNQPPIVYDSGNPFPSYFGD